MTGEPLPDGLAQAKKMTSPRSSVMTAVTSLEVRWILPGHIDIAVARHFRRYCPELEYRQDDYLLSPGVSDLSVKVRGGRALEVKAYLGSPGVLDVPDRARGRLQSWRKWSQPFQPGHQDGRERPGWQRVAKARRIVRFSLGSNQIMADPEHRPGRCTAELTEVRASGRTWWSLAFEASEPVNLRRDEFQATAVHVLTQTLPDGVLLRADDSKSYAEWLRGLMTSGETG
jgi:hypothetical protein